MSSLPARFCYSLLMYLATVPVLLYLCWRSRKDKRYRQRLAERLALQQVPEQARGGLVIHAVSVGEVVAATPLINALAQQYPDLMLTICCTTPTGSERIRQSFAGAMYHCYLPLDTPGAVKRFLNKLQPQAVIVLETELWPNLLQQCRRALIPSIVVNARLSARSARGYRRFYGFSQLALRNISLLLAQNTQTARRFVALGCSAQVQVCGNLKFDMAVPDNQQTVLAQYLPQFSGRRLWVAGSTHAGEDEIILAAYQQLLARFPELLLILVPRHPERCARVAQLVEQAGLSLQTRSSGQAIRAQTQVMLGDSMGELLAWYQAADVVFIGGSLIERGGHNPLEAMALSKPIQSGPHVFNFAQPYQWLNKADAVNIVSDSTSLALSTERLLSEPELAVRQGATALALYRQHSGAATRSAAAIAAYLGEDINSFAVTGAGRSISWYQQDVFAKPSALSFSPRHWQQPEAVLGQSQGRNTAWFVRYQRSSFVLRHYYRGGLLGKVVKDTFSYQCVLQSRAMQEFSLLRHMRRSGLPVPRPLAAQYLRASVGYQADMMITLIEGSQDLFHLLRDGQALTEAQWQQLGALIARFHQAGVYHSDLNCHNILLDSKAQFWLIDFDKCALLPAGAWQQANLARLQRSLRKELLLHPGFAWDESQWPWLLYGYNRQVNVN